MKKIIINTFFFLNFIIAFADDLTIQQTIIFSVQEENEFGPISGPAPIFHMQHQKNSECPFITVQNVYNVSVNQTNKKITGVLDLNMPEMTALAVNFTAPKGARSTGTQNLCTIPVDLVIEISNITEEGIPLVYRFSVSDQVGTIPLTSRIVTYTLTDA